MTTYVILQLRHGNSVVRLFVEEAAPSTETIHYTEALLGALLTFIKNIVQDCWKPGGEDGVFGVFATTFIENSAKNVPALA